MAWSDGWIDVGGTSGTTVARCHQNVFSNHANAEQDVQKKHCGALENRKKQVGLNTIHKNKHEHNHRTQTYRA